MNVFTISSTDRSVDITLNYRYPPALYRLAASTALMTAVLFLCYFGLSGFTSSATPAMIGGLIWMWLSASLLAGQRKRAYVAFVVSLVCAVALFVNVYGLGFSKLNLQWILAALLALTVVLACLLFVILWRQPHKILRPTNRGQQPDEQYRR